MYYNGAEQGEVLTPITDDEYDALVQREAEICERFPNLMARLEIDSGLGSIATRFGGRVGPVIIDEISNISKEAQKVEHLKMLSLENAMNDDQVLLWIERMHKKLLIDPSFGETNNSNGILINATPKLDGLSLTLRYNFVGNISNDKSSNECNYELKCAVTRGNGLIGDDVTEAVSCIKSIPEKIQFISTSSSPVNFFEVRGEIVSDVFV